MRLQILELPLDHSSDGQVQTPFALVVDRCDITDVQYSTSGLGDFAKSAGARALLVTPDEVELP
ncbi:hypothetical protein AB0P21_09565 [Kribbella sp. NPDC056861]|uniref:hypothetical protein n=1 Tax=Kribbella sp. NPDC056861 TaxID=3154857 RepID=UPI00342BFDE8